MSGRLDVGLTGPQSRCYGVGLVGERDKISSSLLRKDCDGGGTIMSAGGAAGCGGCPSGGECPQAIINAASPATPIHLFCL